jgi:hypothetical protein
VKHFLELRIRLFKEKRMVAREIAWWKRGVIYQIYPRSFQDSNSLGFKFEVQLPEVR